ncbi:MAG: hypothetical protein GWP91_24530 [Rhodobacterales bacterium]|nr:hypothetical protein [Rhodobacterales bacterium]
MGQQKGDDDATDVIESTGYTEQGSGPAADTAGFEMSTPTGWRPIEEDLAPEPKWSEDRNRPAAPTMISREKLAHAMVPPPPEEVNWRGPLLKAGGVLLLGVVAGGGYLMYQARFMPPEPIVTAVAAPVAPDPTLEPVKLEGVRVRAGIQQAPKPQAMRGDVRNRVPSGGRIEDAPREPTSPADAEGEGALEASD